MLFLLVLLGFNLFNFECGRRKVEVMDGGGYSLAIKRLECLNSTDVTFHACKHKLIRGKTGELSVGFTFLRSFSYLFYRVMVERKTSANFYIPTVMDVTFNLCEITRNEMAMSTMKSLLSLFLPDPMLLMRPFLHPCPYVGKHEVLNVVIDKMTVPNVLSTGDAKLIGIVMDGEKKKLLEIQIYVYIKSPSLMQIN